MIDQEAPYWNSYKAGVGLGLVLLAAFVIMGRGVGASGAMTRFASYGAHKVEAVARGGTKAEAHTAAKANKYMSSYIAGDGDPLDDYNVYVFIGTLIGGFLSAFAARRISFRTEHGPNTTSNRRVILAFIGGIIAAYGARLARGCTSGQGITGGASLALGSWIFIIAVFAAGYAGAYFFRKEWI